MTARRTKPAKNDVFPDGVWNERHAIFFDEFLILGGIGGALDEAAGHRPVVDAELQNHEEMHADEGDQQSGNDENVESKEARERGTGNDGSTEHAAARWRDQ